MPVRVLIVDDQETYRKAARLVVSMTEGFEVAAEAVTAEDALAAMDAVAPDLVLMDVNLPGIDGIEATRRIREGWPRTVVVVVSTYEEAEFGPRAVEAGAVAYVSKGAFGPDRLVAAWEASRSV